MALMGIFRYLKGQHALSIGLNMYSVIHNSSVRVALCTTFDFVYSVYGLVRHTCV